MGGNSKSRGNLCAGVACGGCGRRFLPDNTRKKFCDHACYSASLRVGIQDRFWSKVNKTSGCWLWTAGTIRGYGQFNLGRVAGKSRTAYAHRVSWELAHGPVAGDLSVLHRCDVPLCVNPEHLFLGTQQDNLADARQKGRLNESLPRAGALTYADRLAIFNTQPYQGIGVDLACHYGVSRTCISHVRNGRFAHAPHQPLQPSSARAEQPRRDLHPMDRVFQRVSVVTIRVVGDVR